MSYTERRREVELARDAFLRAAAALTEWPIDKGALPFALLEAAVGMLHLAAADEGELARARVMEAIKHERARRK